MRRRKTRSAAAGVTLGSLAAAAVLAVLACGESGEHRPELEPAPVRVVLRLGPSDFEAAPVSYHGAVAPIGNEARPVVVAPVSEPVLSLPPQAPDQERRVRAEFELPEAVRALPTAAFTLQVQRFPGAAPPELFAKMQQTILSRHVSTGWTLERAADGSAVLVYEHDDFVNTHLYGLHLSALRPGPERLSSRVFEVPEHATLELAYGLTTLPGAEGSVPARFRAELDCDGESIRTVVDEQVRGASDSPEMGWREIATSLPAAGGSCQLDLSASGPDGNSVLGAVWAVPRVLARENRDASAVDYNIVMVSLDTLRADHLSGFGYPRATSPRIDAGLIAQGTSFRDVTSTYSRTNISHMSLFTGLYPEARPQKDRLAAHSPVPTLAEWLREAGFDTAAFTEDGLLAGVFGFWFGFDRFRERSYSHAIPIFEDAVAYLKSHRDRPFFLFVHTYKTHAPYHVSPPYQELFTEASDWELPGMSPVPEKHRDLADEYDRTIREADDLVGGLLDELDALGLAERTLVVLLSDHGESFGEHGVVGHSYSGHQEVIRVPLILRGPGVPRGVSVETPVSLVDVAPSLLELIGLPAPEPSQGISLVPALRGDSLPAERAIHFSWLATEAAGVRYGPFKYKRAKGHRALYDLSKDPGERKPLAGPPTRPIAERLIADHEAASATLRKAFEDATQAVEAMPATVSPEMEESLRALGYIE